MGAIWDMLILNPMINSLLVIYNLLGQNFGLAIIVFTILVRLITLPLTLKQQQSTQKMQELQQDKDWLKIQEKYKNDKQKLQEEQLKMYQEKGINPLSGCLPLIIQLPIIFGLYGAITRALGSTPLPYLELSRHLYGFEIFGQSLSSLIPLNSTFLWIPDLGQPERWTPDFLSFGIPILTIIVVITTYLQSKLTTPPTATGQGQQGAAMGQVMSLYMPLFLGYFAYTLAAGLALYFVISNLMVIGQYAVAGKTDWRNILPAALRREPPPPVKKGARKKTP
jgi:YidC/Oxa1 family membrane protein insertase